ncbi:PaaI family thioesterase [Streptomyces albidoflavus]|uniref:PaaI family thioesterase n=1 Tax=Streptomyces albidoflavus TaxID=1886 RepID=UPI0021D5FA1A|nr:PaaI family thioesterase [Streptomyces albidoflavus]MCU7705529.1 PaaI family thioesterase [Streptomyces albidoflavus]
MTEKSSAATPEGAVAEGELTALLGTMPYAVSLGVEREAASPAETRGHLHWAPERCTIGGALHGGALMSLADAVGAVCAYLNLPPGAAGTTTVESKTNFFRALREGTARAVARPLHTGRSFVVVQTDLYDDEGRLLGQTTQTQAVLLPRT